MKSPLTLIALIIGAGLVYNIIPFTRDAYKRFRYRKVLTCPETEGLADVQLRAGWAAVTAVFGKPALRVKDCSMWPGKKRCAQECVKENWAQV